MEVEEVLVFFLEVDDDDEEASRFRLRDMTKSVYWYTRYKVYLYVLQAVESNHSLTGR